MRLHIIPEATLKKMPGGYEDKYADLRILYGLSMFLPGKKLMFMGQELGMLGGFDGNHYIDWSVLEFDANKYIQKYVKELNALYLAEPALYESEKLPFVFPSIRNRIRFALHGQARPAEDSLLSATLVRQILKITVL